MKTDGRSAAAWDKKLKQDQHNTRLRSMAGREIGAIPPVEDYERRAEAMRSFRFFCETYFPHKFDKAWSDDHIKILDKIQRAVVQGGLFAMAMPRGSGKTTLSECGVEWSAIIGRHQYVELIGATADLAKSMFENIRLDLMTNELLLADFPETIFPINALKGESRRAAGQLHHGERTHIEWTANKLVFPAIPGSKAAGTVIESNGLTGSIRGRKYTRFDGKTVRPSLVIIDDPQTDESAKSPSQCKAREALINGTILNLAGPGQKISAVMPCTVIAEGDLADRMLNRDIHPEWQGERTKLVYSFPANHELWDEYAEIRAKSLANDGDLTPATEFYEQNREAMDEGAEVAWPERYNDDEVSALQHAINLKLRDEHAFYAEYQNEPMPIEKDDTRITPDELVKRLNGLKPRQLPADATHMTAFIDVQQNVLFYCVCAWWEGFSGCVVDYGAFPDQKLRYFTLNEIRKTLQGEYTGAGVDGAIQSGLITLIDRLVEKEWSVAGGGKAKVDRILVDSGYKADQVHAACRMNASISIPSKGVGVKAGNKPMSAYKRKSGEVHGEAWYMPNVKRTREFRHVLYDTNYWKTFVHSRFGTTPGDKGSMTLWGKDPREHRMFADHVSDSEYAVVTEGHGRVVKEWTLKPSRPDNHLFDCVVGCAVAASMIGMRYGESAIPKPVQRTRKKVQKLQM